MVSTLKKEFDFYLAHQAELAGKYDGKFVVIKDERVIGVFDTALLAMTETRKSHELGTFLVQAVTKDASGYTATFHSRVAFS